MSRVIVELSAWAEIAKRLPIGCRVVVDQEPEWTGIVHAHNTNCDVVKRVVIVRDGEDQKKINFWHAKVHPLHEIS